MEEVVLYADLISEPCRSLIAFCRLSSIPFRHAEISLVDKEFLSESFTLINPLQKIPFLVHGDFKLSESAAILMYLAEVFNVDNQWLPRDLRVRSKISSYLHWHHIGFRHKIDEYLQPKAIWPVIFDMHYLNPEWEKWLIIGVNGALSDLTLILKETGYVGKTSEPSIADIFAYSQLTVLPMINMGIEEYPEIKEWKEKIEKIEVVQEAHEKFRGWLAGMLVKIAAYEGGKWEN